jgi:predicted metalloprotease with PDZ domain
MTSYLGDLLAARAGLRSPSLAREQLAAIAADMALRAGRAWRPLQDTSTAAAVGTGGPDEWQSWRRGLDYYPEGVLLWLEVDTTLRAASGGSASIDDFAKRFFGGASGGPEVKPYGFDDVVAALDATARHDWRRLLRERLDSIGAEAPLGGLQASGWRLVYSSQDNEAIQANEKAQKSMWLRASIGCILREDGTIVDASPTMPAARAGAAPGMKVRAVNGRRFTPEAMRDAIRSSTERKAIDLVVENGEWWRTLHVAYDGGARHPHLERIDGTPDLLSSILSSGLSPRAK